MIVYSRLKTKHSINECHKNNKFHEYNCPVFIILFPNLISLQQKLVGLPVLLLAIVESTVPLSEVEGRMKGTL